MKREAIRPQRETKSPRHHSVSIPQIRAGGNVYPLFSSVFAADSVILHHGTVDRGAECVDRRADDIRVNAYAPYHAVIGADADIRHRLRRRTLRERVLFVGLQQIGDVEELTL